MNAVSQIEQRTEEWFKARLGKFTGSQIFRLMTDPRSKVDKEAGKPSESFKTYVLEAVGEMMTGEQAGFEGNDATRWGEENEPIAIDIYEMETGNIVSDCPYVPINDNCGASPDGSVIENGEQGSVEIKCFDTVANHLKWFLIEGLEEFEGDYRNRFHLRDAESFKKVKDGKKFYYQMQTEMKALKALWCDFVSFRPDVAFKSQFICIRIYADSIEQEFILERVDKAVDLRDALIERFTI